MNNLLNFIKDESGNSIINYCLISSAATAALVHPLRQVGKGFSAVLLTAAKAMATH